LHRGINSKDARTAELQSRSPLKKEQDHPDRINSVRAVGHALMPIESKPTDDNSTWRIIMKKLITALAVVTLIALPTFAQSVSAAPVSPSSSSFGGNGY
jgi:hypothetical protein